MATTVLQCDCGFEASAEDADGLVAEIRRHAQEEHGMTLSLAEARLVASSALTVESSSRAAPHRRVGKQQKEDK